MKIDPIDVDDGLGDIKYDYELVIIDADTIAYTSCLECEVKQEELPKEFYSDEEWQEIITAPGYYEPEHAIYTIDLEETLENAKARVEWVRSQTGAREVFLALSDGRTFRHEIYPEYKANRLRLRYPEGLKTIKHLLAESYPSEVCDGYEADDLVVWMYKHTDNSILAAIDKDVLYSIPGKHLNYYRSVKYDISPKWVEVDEATATRWPYIQCLAGDSTDNIKGIPKIGPEKAQRILGDETDPLGLWRRTLEAYRDAGLTRADAILNMQLVNLHQLDENRKVKLWEPPF